MSESPRSGASGEHRGRRVAALDGLRAVAVVAVVLYHVDHERFPGGFLGVDLFFVLSGYLITTLLLVEHGGGSGISLRRFWGRRLRRLWPLAWVTLAAVSLASLAGVWGADRQRGLPGEIAAAVAQVANWHQVSHGGYVEATSAPSPLRHFWSLAIEEQFYVVWPLLLTAVLAVGPVWRRRVVPLVLAALGVASIGAGWWHAGAADRAYLGTDVRLVAIVAGAMLAWALRDRPMRGPGPRPARVVLAVGGTLALAAMATAVFVLHADSGLLARGGFAVVALAGAMVVGFALSPSGFSAALSWPPLVWLGGVSYAVYLVHWPMLVALGPDRSVAVRLLVAGPGAVAVAAVLHRVVERPMIERRIELRRVAVMAAALVAVSVAALVASVPEGRTPSEQVARSLDTVPDPTTTTAAAEPGSPTTTCVPTTVPVPGEGGLSPSEEVNEDPTGTGCEEQVVVMVVGDSTGRGAANGLRRLGDERLVVWDRTILGCSFGDEDCPDWRVAWRLGIDSIDPDVVLVVTGVVTDLHGVDDPPFLSPDGAAVRAATFDEALDVLGSRGAAVVWTVPAVPLRPRGLFFCDGRATRSQCDPEWVAQWSADVAAAADRAGATVADLAAWAAFRGNTDEDRPDGVHYSSAALRAQAEWLAPQLLTASGP